MKPLLITFNALSSIVELLIISPYYVLFYLQKKANIPLKILAPILGDIIHNVLEKGILVYIYKEVYIEPNF